MITDIVTQKRRNRFEVDREEIDPICRIDVHVFNDASVLQCDRSFTDGEFLLRVRLARYV